MTRPPMRRPARVPGFAAVAAGARAGADAPARSAPPASAVVPVPGPLDAYGTRQLNVRVPAPVLDRYHRLLRDCHDAGLRTSMTELVQALLHGGPPDPAAARELVRQYRSARAHDL